uniref:MULE transposase domain-containing protein n=1 Tax=Lactuca sativa TaxID=4236 RepID=A0A9R1V1Q8_LACSA|nr:hypothetical protein LSAT_V11C700351760 [Lactuca sativa]
MVDTAKSFEYYKTIQFEGESSSSVDDVQYHYILIKKAFFLSPHSFETPIYFCATRGHSPSCSNVIGEHVYKPDVPIQFIQFKCLIFKSLELAIKMHYEYAEIGGFDVRLSTQSRFDNKIIKKIHVICNPGSKQKNKYCDTLVTSGVMRKQNSNSRVISCQAKIIFESVYGTLDYKFDELHNYPLEKRMCASMSKIGPTMAHKLRESLRCEYERDINRIIGYKDAQMIVSTMNDRRTHYPNYSFEFKCQDDVLDSMFWADEMEKAYYNEFGDVISFDATFRINKYRMVFVSFTAIDHHKNSVIDGTGLLSNESIESYSWLLKCFLKLLGKNQHLCLFMNIDFRKRFSKLVWDINMKLDVFEVKWGLLMKEFNLKGTRWFKNIFTKRDSWIRGYFNNIPMCGLIKTTSRSKSMNSFFNTYSESGNLLLNFMMNYNTVIQKQRNTERELDKASKKASYKMETPREIELQASKMGEKFTLCNKTVKANFKVNLSFLVLFIYEYMQIIKINNHIHIYMDRTMLKIHKHSITNIILLTMYSLAG